MADKRTILIQFDSDTHASVFDRVVAIDAGADEVFSYGGVRAETVRDLVHGAIFTRGPRDLKRTAIFIVASQLRDRVAGAKLSAVGVAGPADLPAALEGRDLVIAAGAAGICLLPADAWKNCPGLRVLVDLNAVPPTGIEGVELTDAGVQR